MASLLAQYGRLNFNGVSDYVDLGDSFGGLAAMTIACWCFVAATPPPGTSYIIVSKFGNNSAYDASDAFDLYYDGNFNFILGGPNAVAVSSAVAINTLVHVAATYDGAAITVYLNGVSAGAQAASGAINAAAGTNCYIGYSVDPTFASHFNGWLDDLRIYSGALTAAEVAALAAGVKLKFRPGISGGLA